MKTTKTETTKKTTYAVVTFGTSPRNTIFAKLDHAIAAAEAAIGRGSCVCARVYRCDSRELAKTADISVVRKGETIVYPA